MSNDHNWQPPVEAPDSTAAAPFGSAAGPAGTPPGTPAVTPPGTPIPPAGANPNQGWTPPPKPGLIPLRPLDFGTILGAAFRTLRRNPKPTYGAALIVYGATVVLTAVAVGLVSFASISRLTTASTEDIDAIAAGTVAATLLATVVPMILSIIGTAVLQGILVVEVARATLGEKLGLRGLLAQVKGRYGALIGWAFILVAVGLVAITVLVLLVVVFGFLVGGVAGAVLGVAIGIFGGLGLAVLYVWLGTKVSLVPSVMVLERAKLTTSVARSWSLTNGHFWRTFGVQAVVALIIGLAIQFITTPISLVAGIMLSLVDPNSSDSGTVIVVGIILTIVSYIVMIAVGALGAVVQSAAPALVYVDLRIRKEGLDLELIRFIEQRQAGVRDQPDPFRTHAHGVPEASWSTLQPPNSASPWA